jgi:hypothetical protein
VGRAAASTRKLSSVQHWCRVRQLSHLPPLIQHLSTGINELDTIVCDRIVGCGDHDSGSPSCLQRSEGHEHAASAPVNAGTPASAITCS